MNIGIFSGSFNPIHVGHLILANYIVEYTDVDEVWLLVSPQNPWKVGDEDLLDENIRLEMTRLATDEYPKLKVSDFEFALPRPSYTINTLDALNEKYPEHNFSLIIGADNWSAFENWKNYERIIKDYKVKIYPRLDHRISVSPKLKKTVEALDSPIIEISSSFIREAVSEGKDVRAFLPTEVYEYIKEKGLYR